MANRKITFSKTKLASSIAVNRASTAKQIGVAAALMLGASNVGALGLGALEIDSNLDQPLKGTIELNAAVGDDIDTVTAIIASKEDFDSLGIDYPGYLKDISLSVDKNSSGTTLLVSSNQVVIKEPFIHFLVRVEWSGGSFLREYTALIDPPVYAAEAPQSVAEPREVGTDQSYESGTVDAPDVEPDTYDQVIADDEVNDAAAEEEVVAESIEEAVDAEEAPLIEDDFYNDEESEDVSSSGDTVADSDASQLTDAQYGPVANGESLSLIAQELQRQFPDLSIYQIMQVLFQENESSFINGNINGLIRGSILNIGDLNAIRAVDVEQSKEFFRTQLSEWDPSVLVASNSDSINVGQDDYNFSDDTSGGDFDSSSSAAEDSFQIGASSEQDDFVSSDQGENRAGEVLALRQELSQLEVSLKSSEEENKELKDRVSLLEGQLADMNRLVSLDVEDSELANLESTLAAQNEESDESNALDEFLNDTEDQASDLLADAEETAEELGSEAGQALDDGSDLLDEGADLADDAESSIDEFLSDTGTEIDDTVGELTDDVVDDTESVLDDASDALDEAVTDAAPVVAAPVSSTVTEKPQSFMDKAKSTIIDGGLWKIIAGLGGLLVAGVGLLLFRRRQADEEFEISMLSIESNSHTIANSEDSASASMSMSHTASVADEAINPDKETSFLTVYSDSDAVVQADEVDPVAEADVYIAYGRDEQAEEVLLDGVASHPERVDIKQKLLTLYHKRQNAEGFERIAEELYSQRASLTGDVWQEVSQMGKEIAPNNPLFGLSGDDLSAAIETDSELQFGGDDAETPATAEIADAPADDIQADEPKEDEDDALEFEASITAPVAAKAADEIDDASELVVESLNNDESIQLINFDDGRSEISELDEVEIDALDLSESVDLDEDVLELSLDANSDLADLDSDFETSISDAPEVSDLEIDADYDEARTQYELAKVFVDLGDEDGARKILVELVADKNNSASVLEDAQKLLDSINA